MICQYFFIIYHYFMNCNMKGQKKSSDIDSFDKLIGRKTEKQSSVVNVYQTFNRLHSLIR